MVLGGPLVYWAMNIGPVFTQSLGIFLFFVETLLSFTLPSGLANGEPVKEIADKTSAWQSVAQAFRASGDGVSGFGRLFSQNKQLSFLLISVIFSTIGLRQSGIRQQYATHRYGWSWATVSTITGRVQFICSSLVEAALTFTRGTKGRSDGLGYIYCHAVYYARPGSCWKSIPA